MSVCRFLSREGVVFGKTFKSGDSTARNLFLIDDFLDGWRISHGLRCNRSGFTRDKHMAKHNSAEIVEVGTSVKVLEQGSGDAEVFYIVENWETDYLENKISPDNPVARALIGCKPGRMSRLKAQMAR